MKLSGRPLTNIVSVNSYNETEELEFHVGDATTLYLQLVDLDQRPSSQGYYPQGRRYMPAVGATLSVTFENLDNAKRLVRSATQPYNQDSSIWAVPILATDPVSGTVGIKCVLTESGVTKTFTLQASILGYV
jgi:hypothetical protein